MGRFCSLVCIVLILCLTVLPPMAVFADETDPPAPEPSETQPAEPALTEPAPSETQPPAPEPPAESTEPGGEPSESEEPAPSQEPEESTQPSEPAPTAPGGSWTPPPSGTWTEEEPDEDLVFILKQEAPATVPAELSIETRNDAGGLAYEIPEDWTAQDVINWFVLNYDLDQEEFAISFYCPATGERAAWNEDTYMLAASTYKLPLNLYYYEMEAAGVYSSGMSIGGTTLANAHYESLVWSMNEVSHAMIYNLGSFYTYKKLMLDRYGDLEEDLVAAGYWSDNYYSTHFMLNVLTYLYEHLEEFPQLQDYLLQAMPDRYLQEYRGETPVAHKYGTLDGHENDLGLVFTEEPFLVAVYTRNVYTPVSGEELVGRIGCALIAYQTQRTQTNRRLAEEAETEAPEETLPETEAPETTAATEAPETIPQETAAPREAAPAETGTPWYFYAFPVVMLAGGAGMYLLFRKRR